MNSANPQSLPFETHVRPVATLLSRVLRGHLLHRYRGALPLVEMHRIFGEVEQLAEATGFPHLVLPELAEECLRHAATEHPALEIEAHAA